MLPLNTTTQPNAIEQLFCQPFTQLIPIGGDTLSPADKRLFLQITHLREANPPGKQLQGCVDVNEDDFLQLAGYTQINNALKTYFTYTLCYRTKLLLCHINNNTGSFFAYLVYLQYMASKHNKTHINLRYFCETIIPHGWPSNTEIKKLVDGLMVTGGKNLITYKSALGSILTYVVQPNNIHTEHAAMEAIKKVTESASKLKIKLPDSLNFFNHPKL